jgi:hypothetical protein
MERTNEQMSTNTKVVALALVTATSMVTAWFQTGMTGTAKFTNVGVAGVVTATVMIIGFAALKRRGSSA